MKKILSAILCLIMLLSLVGCGKSKDDYKAISGLDTDKDVNLVIAIPYETNKALNTIANSFMQKYSNVSIQLQYIEDYDKNALQLFKDNAVDIILQKDITFTEYTETNENDEKIPTGFTTDDYFYNFASDEEIDFSDTTPDITDNYRHTRTDEAGNEISYIYSYPMGGETRGLFVNKTLLDAYGLAVPTNYDQLLSCCEILKANGLVPIQGSPDTAAYSLGLAVASGTVVHNEAALENLAAAMPGISGEFESILSKLYTLATNRYFDYKAIEESGYYTISNELGQSESFLGLKTDESTFEVSKPENNYGNVAFMPYLSSMETVIDSLITEYKLDTEVEFICSPLNDEGASPAYITPYFGICANKNSENLIWIREFVNFMFKAENNKLYAEEASIIPNTTDIMQIVAEKYDLNPETDVTLCGQIKFSDDYNAYSPISRALKNALKCSAQKYMVNLNLDESGNIQYETDENGNEFLYLGDGETTISPEYVGKEDSAKPGFAFCTLEYYINGLENDFAEYRVG